MHLSPQRSGPRVSSSQSGSQYDARSLFAIALSRLSLESGSGQSFSSKPSKLVLGFGPFVGINGIEILHVRKLKNTLNTPVIVENKAGVCENVTSNHLFPALLNMPVIADGSIAPRMGMGVYAFFDVLEHGCISSDLTMV